MRRVLATIAFCAIIAICTANSYWIEQQNRLLGSLGVDATVLTAYNNTFSPVLSLGKIMSILKLAKADH